MRTPSVTAVTVPAVGHSQLEGPQLCCWAISHDLPAGGHRDLLVSPHLSLMLLPSCPHTLPVLFLSCSLSCIGVSEPLLLMLRMLPMLLNVQPATASTHVAHLAMAWLHQTTEFIMPAIPLSCCICVLAQTLHVPADMVNLTICQQFQH